MVEAPSALQATGRLRHAPRRDKQGKNLPTRAVEILNEWKAGQPQAPEKRAQREDDGAHQGFLAQAEDR